jgi:hypothetical protein
VLAGPARRLGERVLGLLLGADEQDAIATAHRLAHEVERLLEA